ncbi:MAG TPA: hypothetical protein EYP14_06505, partial [Planctomycetaceae bacterium]|nr:hypothetical protein [Planctomycetaceae bacterium]
MTISSFPLSYCTNLHPGRSVEQVDHGLTEFTSAVQRCLGEPIAAGLWLARSVVDELLRTPDGLARFRDRLRDRDLVCYTLNAFPYGDFHRDRVKQDVYRPDWSSPQRLQYTTDCARVLAELLPDGCDGSLSTLPLAFAP